MPFQRVHVFIVNYNSHELLRSCLESLKSEPIARIHIIDNFCSSFEREQLVGIVEKFPLATLTLNDTNLGFGPALNRAIESAALMADDIIWMLNPDTKVESGSVAAMLAFMETGYDLVSPNILTGTAANPRVWFSGGVLDKSQIRTQHVGLGNTWSAEGHLAPSEVEATFITGAAMMMRCSTWRRIGGFRESFFLYWEDADLSDRAVALGYRLGVAPFASIWHAVGGSGGAPGMSSTYYYYMQRNRLWFGRGWKSRRQIILGAGLRETVALTFRPLKEKNSPISKTLASVRGLIHGLFQAPL